MKSVPDLSDLSLDREQLDGWDGAFFSLKLPSAQGLASLGWGITCIKLKLI